MALPLPGSAPAPGRDFSDLRAKSMSVFRRFLGPPGDEGGAWDASRVVGRECFEEWKKGRTRLEDASLEDQAKIFQRNLTGHLTGVDGRVPFAPEEEQAILAVVRQKKVW